MWLRTNTEKAGELYMEEHTMIVAPSNSIVP